MADRVDLSFMMDPGTGLLYPGLTLVVGHAGTGKTLLALEIIRHLKRHPAHQILVVSENMGEWLNVAEMVFKDNPWSMGFEIVPAAEPLKLGALLKDTVIFDSPPKNLGLLRDRTVLCISNKASASHELQFKANLIVRLERVREGVGRAVVTKNREAMSGSVLDFQILPRLGIVSAGYAAYTPISRLDRLLSDEDFVTDG